MKLLDTNEVSSNGIGDTRDTKVNHHYSQEKPFLAKLISNKRVTADDHWQDVRLIKLDIEDSGIK